MSKSASQRSPGRLRSASPYWIGAGIGLLNMGAFVAFRKGIGVSGAYETGAALAARKMAPDALRVNDFVKARDKAPQLDWEVLLVVGTVLGGLLASRSERAVGGSR